MKRLKFIYLCASGLLNDPCSRSDTVTSNDTSIIVMQPTGKFADWNRCRRIYGPFQAVVWRD
jgi:hypothetical protein